jgi:hypothetical protein
VVIRGNIGHRIKKVFSENGSIELRSPNEMVVETVESKKGSVLIAGSVRAKSIKGMRVSLIEGSLIARSINGEQSIDLKGGTIEADLVMSPSVTVSQTVRGKATVIESQNELGPHQLKGGFRMAEFLEMIPSTQKVIQSEASHFPQLSAGMPRQPATSMPGIPGENRTVQGSATAVEDAADNGGWFDRGEGAAATADGGASNGAEAAAEAEAPAVEEPPPVEEEAPAPPPRPAFHPALAEMCEQIARVYTAQNLATPPPVSKLGAMVEAGEYATVKTQLTTIWNQLIQYHKESKLPFAVKTTQMFQSIQRTLAANV